MPYLLLATGIGCGLLFVLFARSRGYEQGNVLAVGLLLAAAVYVGFALLWGNDGMVRLEVIGLSLFSLFAFLARRFVLGWLGFGWLLHIAWDYGLHVDGVGSHFTPDWYPPICMGFDFIVGAYIFLLVWQGYKKQQHKLNRP